MDTMFQIDDSVLLDPNYTIEYYSQKTIMMRESSQIKIAECLHIKQHKPSERIFKLKGDVIYDLSSNLKDSALYMADYTNRLYTNIKKFYIFKNLKGDLVAAIEKKIWLYDDKKEIMERVSRQWTLMID